MALMRLKSEFAKLKQDPPPLCYAGPINDDNFFVWNAMIVGPPGSPYTGTAFPLRIEFTYEHPFKPPKVYFISRIYHPNIDEEHGNICMDILSTTWSPAYSVSKVLICITAILSDPLMDDTPLNLDAAEMYKTDLSTYYKRAEDSSKNKFFSPIFQRLFLKFFYWRFGSSRKKLLKYDVERTEILFEDLCYPHDKLDKIYNTFEKNSYTFLPAKVVKAYKKATKLYPFIKAAENSKNIEDWVNAIINFDDNEFIENNIECALFEDFPKANFVGNKVRELYKLYFKYLRKKNSKKLLQMYSYYCRFFPDDKDIFDEYEKAVKEFGPSFVSWKNPFKFEKFDENIILESAIIKTPKTIIENVKPITSFFTFENAVSQNFTFKPPFMNYILLILQNSPPEMIQRLQKTCKYFFHLIPTPVCYKLEITNETRKPIMKKHSAIFNEENLQSSFSFENIHLSTVLSAKSLNDNLTLSKCLPKLFKCDAKYISISSQDLTEMEFKFLIKSKRVIELELENTYIFDESGNGIMLEEILELTPKIKRFRLDIVQCNPQTSKIMSEFPFENKIETFQLKNIPNANFVASDFAEFVAKNTAPSSEIIIRFHPNVNQNYKRIFAETVKAHVNEIWLESLQPNVTIS